MKTSNENERLIEAILANSVNNNIFSNELSAGSEVIELSIKVAREDGSLLSRVLLKYGNHAVVKELKFAALTALSMNPRSNLFQKVFPSIINTLEDIHNYAFFLTSKQTNSYGFELNDLARKSLKNRLENLSESDLAPYYKPAKHKDTLNISKLAELLQPKYANPNIEKAIKILFGKSSKREIKEKELPILWGLKSVESEKDPSQIINLINEYKLNSKWIVPLIETKDYNLLRFLIDSLQPGELIELMDSFGKLGFINKNELRNFYSADFGYYSSELEDLNVSFCDSVDDHDYRLFKFVHEYHKDIIFVKAIKYHDSKSIIKLLNLEYNKLGFSIYHINDKYNHMSEILSANLWKLIISKIQYGLMDEDELSLPFDFFFALMEFCKDDHELSFEFFMLFNKFLCHAYCKKSPALSNKRVAFFIDSSRSMDNSSELPLTNQIAFSILEFAFPLAFWMKRRFDMFSKDFYSFRDKVHSIGRNNEDHFDPLISSYKEFFSYFLYGYKLEDFDDISNPLAPLEYLINQNEKYDLVLIFTDYDFNSSSVKLWKKYKNKIAPNCILFLVQLKPFYLEPIELPDDYYRIVGWNENTAKIIFNIINFKFSTKEVTN